MHSDRSWLFALWLHIRRTRWMTVLLGYYYQPEISKLEIDISYACNLRCAHCDRSSAQVAAADAMSLEQIRGFVADCVRTGKHWREISLLGGEPTLHPQFFEILNELRTFRDEYSPQTLLRVKTNGFGKKVEDALAKIPADVVVENSHKIGSKNVFEDFNRAPLDSASYRYSDFANGCWVTQDCGIGLNAYGYYPCGVAASMDRILGDKAGLADIPQDECQLREQMKRFCSRCGHFKSRPKLTDEPRYSEFWIKAYAAWAERRPQLVRIYDKATAKESGSRLAPDSLGGGEVDPLINPKPSIGGIVDSEVS